jgi:ATP-binding cassette subfamily E protein 1
MKRLAIIDNEKLKHMEDKLHIQSLCPVNRRDSDCMYFEGEKLLIDEVLCIGCGICVKAAPEAISIINFPEEMKKTPLHQYGKNGFRIFELPQIQEGSITGIMGRNGIGKSTVINVLSNTHQANFANFEGKKETEEDYFRILIERFKATSLQNYFTKLSKGEIKVAYKPQQIVNIPKHFKGKVSGLLERVNSKKEAIESLTKELNIKQILDRDISVLSGGELQRVALCAALLKEDANLLVLDEITNYLDIYERLNSSKSIKEHSKGKTTLVVEHDLVVLDFLLEYCHIMYGQPGAYGMLTGVKTAKECINTYLAGYSKEENVKFRDKAISFEKDSVLESKKIAIAGKWKEEQISRGTFDLSITSGDIKVAEVMGVVGRNALGKSTFISHIAEKGFEQASVSYKAQLIPREDNLVLAELSQFENYTDNFYQLYVLEPLNIKALEEKEVSSLSGGELQRYAIAKCLLQDANIYLLDEPTAFLDIEDRLRIAKMIKNFIEMKKKSAFIIDHDLVFMDYLCDRLLVFKGEPSIKGQSLAPLSMREGMNSFLKDLEITFRRDESNKRPRVNKEGSVKDQEQKKIGEYYYT